LLVVLLIVMVITITSLAFLSQSDIELACGRNMNLRMQMDYLAESGLEHAKGLILNPHDIASEYWTGGVDQQIVGGDDYYDVEVVRDDSDPTDRCNYIIDCNACRLKNGEKIGRSSLRAELRLDPCIAYWAGTSTTISQRVTINGDVYCNGTLTNDGVINGDVFANGLSGSITGQQKAVGDLSLVWPDIEVTDFSPTYYIGAATYSPENIGSDIHPSGDFSPSGGNPAGIRYRSGNVELPGAVNIEGMLVVDGTLRISGANNSITAVRNFAAVLVNGDVIIDDGGKLEINGLAVVKGRMQISSDDADVSILGGLFVRDGIVETTEDSSGNDNTATLYNSPTWHPSGGQTGGGALEFDGVDDYLQTSDDPNKLQLTGDYTMAVWIKANAIQKDWAAIFSKSSTDGSTNHWTLQFNNINPKKLIIHHPTAIWDTRISLDDVAGAWHHIRVVRSATTVTSYLDGNEVYSNTWSVNPGSGTGYFNIGADRTTSINYVYKGLIDDIRIYDRPPDANETHPSVNPIGHWRLDDRGSSVNVTAAPCKTAIVVWSQAGVAENWGQAAGAFFRSIKRE